ncbi:MAG: ABC transporter substrate-binding protein [Caldimonas sp.]
MNTLLTARSPAPVASPRRRAALAVLLASTLATALALGLAPQAASAQAKPKIVLSVAPTVLSAPFFIAKEKGYFEAAGLDVTVDTSLQNMADNLPLLAAGHYTIVGTSWGTSVFNALSKGTLIRVLATQATMPASGKTPFSLMMSAKAWEQGDKTVASLKGKKVGIIGRGGFAEYDVVSAVTAAGLKADDVELVLMGRNDVGPAISNGAIAAGWGAEPVPTLFAKKGLVKNLTNEAMRGRGAIVFLVNADFVKEHPDAAATFLSVFYKTAKEFDATGWDDPQSLEIVSKHTKLSPEMLKSIRFAIAPTTLEPDFKLASEMEAYFGEKKLLIYPGKLKFADYYSPAITRKALAGQ